MNRIEFLKNLGVKGGTLLAVTCLGGCLTSCDDDDDGVASNPTVDFTLDLTKSENSTLKTVNGFKIVNKVVIVRTEESKFVVVPQRCSHEGLEQVSYSQSAKEFQCSAHGARFDLTGKGLNSKGSGGLALYNTSLNENNLRVYGG